MRSQGQRVLVSLAFEHAVVVFAMTFALGGCRSEPFAIIEGLYIPEETTPNAECYDLVWDFNYGTNVYVVDPDTFSMAIWPDNSGEFPGTMAFYPCTLDDMGFSCSSNYPQFLMDTHCDGEAAKEAYLIMAEGAWTSSTAFDVTFTYRRAIVWEDGTDSTCPDVCTSIWDFSEVLKSPL